MKSRPPWRQRLTTGVVLAIGLCALAVAVGAGVRGHDEPPPYDLAATRACLSSIARVRTAPAVGGYWLYPRLDVRFLQAPEDEEWPLYFAPSTNEARENEVPDSDKMLRRRNVLTERIAEVERWDSRILGCLRVAE